MRVTIEHTTVRSGFFKTTPAIVIAVEFSESEKAIISREGLGEYVVFTPQLYSGLSADAQGPLYVRTLVKGKCTFPYDDLAAARDDEVRLREGLKHLKEAMSHGVEPVKSKDTFEL